MGMAPDPMRNEGWRSFVDRRIWRLIGLVATGTNALQPYAAVDQDVMWLGTVGCVGCWASNHLELLHDRYTLPASCHVTEQGAHTCTAVLHGFLAIMVSAMTPMTVRSDTAIDRDPVLNVRYQCSRPLSYGSMHMTDQQWNHPCRAADHPFSRRSHPMGSAVDTCT
jgi:hypothetical protein